MVAIFPTETVVVRLVRAILADQHDKRTGKGCGSRDAAIAVVAAWQTLSAAVLHAQAGHSLEATSQSK
ncbi:MAG: hypothetical protein ACR2JC_18960 [Chloroflexota bacterium]